MSSRTRNVVLSTVVAALVLLLTALTVLLRDQGADPGLVEPGTQPTGPEVAASDPATAMPTAEAPATAAAGEGLRFSLYVDPGSPASQWLAANAADPATSAEDPAVVAEVADVAAYASATWLRDDDPDAVATQVVELVDRAAEAGATPTLVTAAPGLDDCEPTLTASEPAGPLVSQWYEAVAAAVGDTSVVVVAEPYALRLLSCVREEAEREARLAAVAAATERLRESAPNALVYLGGGGSNYPDADAAVMADRLVAAGVSQARGFAVNLTASRPLPELREYAAAVNQILAEQVGEPLPVAVDTSRNGAEQPPDPACNSADLRYGEPPGPTGSGDPGAGEPELYVWLLQPGVSEGDCGLGRRTDWGDFLPELAVSMAGDA